MFVIPFGSELFANLFESDRGERKSEVMMEKSFESLGFEFFDNFFDSVNRNLRLYILRAHFRLLF